MPRFEDQIYADEPDPGVLSAEISRMIEYTVLTPGQMANPDGYWVKVAVKNKLGKRDDAIRAIDVARMNDLAKRTLKESLVTTGRYERALAKFVNLKALDNVQLD